MTIRNKLTLGFLLIGLLASLTVGFVSAVSLYRITQQQLPIERAINGINLRISQLMSTAKGHRFVSEEYHEHDYEKEYAEAQRHLNELFDTYKKSLDASRIENDEGYSELYRRVSHITSKAREVMAISHEGFASTEEFNEASITEKNTRHVVRDIVLNLGISELSERMNFMQYLSKEALYQYGDQSHIDQWHDSITSLASYLNGLVTIKSDMKMMLLEKIAIYEDTAQTMSFIILRNREKLAQQAQLVAELEEQERELNALIEKQRGEIAQNVEQSVKFTYVVFSVIILLSVLLALIAGWQISRQFSKPIDYLTEKTSKVGRGILNEKISLETGDELQELAESFNAMRIDLKNLKEDLEGRVAKRTKELVKRTAELEREKEAAEKLSDVAVGRELKMAEMKKEIAKLKKPKG